MAPTLTDAAAVVRALGAVQVQDYAGAKKASASTPYVMNSGSTKASHGAPIAISSL